MPTKISAIIIDDEQDSREILRSYLSKYCPQIDLLDECADIIEARKSILKNSPQLVFLDIEMPRGNAFDLLDQWGEINFEVIFITAYSQYAVQAFNLSAAHYLLKPVDIQELKAAIDKVAIKLKTNQRQDYSTLIENIQNKNHQEDKIALPTLEGLIFVKVHQIIRCEADGSYTKIHLEANKILIATRKIKEFEQLLMEHNFFRVHRSHLVNLDKIEKYYKGDGGYVLLSDGSSIDVARRKKEAFLECLNRV